MNSRKFSVENILYNYGLYVIFVLLFAFFTYKKPSFILPGNLVTIILQSSAWSVAVAGLVFVMLTGGIDISIGANMYVTAYMSVRLMELKVIPDTIPGMFMLIAVAIAIGAIMGAINGFCVSVIKLPPLIVTIATTSLFRGFAYTVNRVQTAKFNNNTGELMGRGKLFGVFPVVIFIMLCVIFLGQYVLKYTQFGRQVYAIGNNKIASGQIGIRTSRIIFMVYVICGATAGLCGLLIGAQTNAVTAVFAQNNHFTIISCAVLGGVSLFGGKGSIFPGAFLGIIIAFSIDNGLVFLGADPYLYTIVRGLVIFVAVMMDCIRNKAELR